MPKLKNDQHECFCQEYIIDFNRTRAATDSGYSKKTARSQGCTLFTKPNIQERIAELLKDRSERTKITQDMVVQELAVLAFSDIRHYMDFEEGTGLKIKTFDKIPADKSRAIQSIKETSGKASVTFEYKLHGKERALELLGKHTGMFEDVGDKLAKVVYELSEKFMPKILKKNAKKK